MNKEGCCPHCDCATGLHNASGCQCEGLRNYYPENLTELPMHSLIEKDWIKCMCANTPEEIERLNERCPTR